MARAGADDRDPGWGEGSRYAAHLDRGWSLLDRGDLASARKSAEEAHQLRPEDPDAPILLGAIALAESKAEESVRWYERAVELDPDFVEPYAAAAAVSLFDLGNAERALALCEQAVELEYLQPLEVLDLQLLAAEAQSAMARDAEARARLGSLGEVQVLREVLSLPPVTGDAPAPDLDQETNATRAAAIAHLHYDADGEPLEEEERGQQLGRAVSLALRLARIWLDLGAVTEPRDLLRELADRLPEDADAWHMLSEAEYLSGDPDTATQAAMRTLRLDAESTTPAHVPSPALLHARVVSILKEAPVAAIRELVERPVAFSVLVREAVPPELVLEGMDPRLVVLALSVRGGPGTDPGATPGFVAGVSVYRGALGRATRSADEADAQLRRLLFEELALALELDDEDRARLELTPVIGPPSADK